MQIIKILPTDPRVASAQMSDDGTAAYFPTGGINPDKSPVMVGVAVENGVLVFLPDRAATHAHIMDVLGIPHGRMADVDASDVAAAVVAPQVEADRQNAIAADQTAMAAPAQLAKA